MTRARAERGSATVLALPLLGLLTVLAVLLALAGGAVTARRTAAAAADLAALAGAAAAQDGGDACADARTVARLNGVRLVSCAVDGAEVRVEVRTHTAALLGTTVTVSARSRAGPQPSEPG